MTTKHHKRLFYNSTIVLNITQLLKSPCGTHSAFCSVSRLCIIGTTIVSTDFANNIWDVPNARRSHRKVQYIGVNLQQIIALINQSSGCRQYIRLDCYRARMWNYLEGTFIPDTPITYWVSRNGSQMVNWGGVDTGVQGCACYANRSKFIIT